MLVLHIRNSRLELLFLLVAHVTALFALTLSRVSPVITGLLAVLVVFSLLFHTGLLPALCKPPLKEIQIAAHLCRLVTAQQQVETTLPRVLFFSEWLLLLQFEVLVHNSGQARITRPAQIIVHLLPDSLDRESDRRLRSYLRFQKS